MLPPSNSFDAFKMRLSLVSTDQYLLDHCIYQLCEAIKHCGGNWIYPLLQSESHSLPHYFCCCFETGSFYVSLIGPAKCGSAKNSKVLGLPVCSTTMSDIIPQLLWLPNWNFKIRSMEQWIMLCTCMPVCVCVCMCVSFLIKSSDLQNSDLFLF